MKKINLLFLLFGLGFGNFMFANSSDCSKISNYAEYMMCAFHEIKSLDDNLNKIYKEVLGVTENKEQLKSEQMKWLKIRNECDSYYCLEQAYKDRILNLKNSYSKFKTDKMPKEENSKKYAGVKFGDNINNYKENAYGANFFDMRGTGVSYTYAGFAGHIISSKNDNKIDKINISKSFNNKEELNSLKNNLDEKYNFIEKTDEMKTNIIYDKKYKETTYIYSDENVIIKLIINDYSNFKEIGFYVTLEYLTKNLFDEIKAKEEQVKIKKEQRLNKIKNESQGL